MSTTLTVPTLGWVAKDTTSYSFSVARDGRQQQTESYKPDVGNGLKPDGKPLQSPSPTRTSVAMSASDVGEWVQTIRARDAQRGQRSVDTYILDNEPALWSSTHRDVHPEPLTYDELLEKTIAYGTAVRRADPDAKIAGPAEWGWPAYFFSAKDAKVGFQLKPDRRAHGDVPLIEWYLQKLRDHERASGVRILDVVDLHFYPQGPGIYGGDEKTDPATSALRIRMTRGLWDPTYRDESWIDDTVMLIPRMQAVIERSYPGRRFSIGEWSFGGEGHMSGALAVAESLGRFGQSGLYSAYYWTKPKAGSPAAAAWRAYRDYDGSGGHFLDDSAATTMGKDTSLFASVDSAGKKLVAIALNLSPEEDATARIDLDGCGIATGVRTFRLSSGEHELRAPRQAAAAHDATIEDRLPAYSITVFEVALHAP